ncbi:hypothetical protein CLCR_05287 [Cladophialophora carrionii]|uniref:Uncharacterized protein n=1 Tax=Cladophialophora carrionii TaxID=86049 RepID=A0A1C1CLC0_9EURO|nr:hypothetical protein CLCR_05287 [Cladophialophora carrionii]
MQLRFDSEIAFPPPTITTSSFHLHILGFMRFWFSHPRWKSGFVGAVAPDCRKQPRPSQTVPARDSENPGRHERDLPEFPTKLTRQWSLPGSQLRAR